MKLTWQQRTEQYRAHYQWALHYFELAEIAFEENRLRTCKLYMRDMYVELMEACDVLWVPNRTPKQKLQQKLWQESGSLHRTKANLYNYILPAAHPADKQTIRETITIIDNLINENKHDMRNIK